MSKYKIVTFDYESYVSSDIKEISEITTQARKERTADKGIQNIDGCCHENVIYLCDYFYYHTTYKPYLRWGVVNYQNKEYDDLKKAEHDGCVHFWTEIPINDNTWIYTDLFTMRSQNEGINRGDVYTSDKLPENYYTLKNTLFEYKPQIEPHNLVSYEDIFTLRNYFDIECI